MHDSLKCVNKPRVYNLSGICESSYEHAVMNIQELNDKIVEKFSGNLFTLTS